MEIANTTGRTTNKALAGTSAITRLLRYFHVLYLRKVCTLFLSRDSWSKHQTLSLFITVMHLNYWMIDLHVKIWKFFYFPGKISLEYVLKNGKFSHFNSAAFAALINRPLALAILDLECEFKHETHANPIILWVLSIWLFRVSASLPEERNWSSGMECRRRVIITKSKGFFAKLVPRSLRVLWRGN